MLHRLRTLYFGTQSEGTSLTVETKALFSIAWPVVVNYLVVMLGFTGTVAFMGRLGSAQLGAVSISYLVQNVTGLSVAQGFLSAEETLISQAFGAQNNKRVGLIFQKALAISTVLAVPCCIIWLCTELLLLLLGQDPEVAYLAGVWCQISAIGIFPMFWAEAVKRYLQMQGIVNPVLYAQIVVDVFIFAGLFISVDLVPSLGFAGGALTGALSNWLMLLLLVGYIVVRKVHKPTWYGWSREALQNWLEFFKLGIPGMLMLSGEWWGFELMALMAGWNGELALAAHAIIVQSCAIWFMIPLGVNIAASARIGNLLGAGEHEKAKIVARLVLLFSVSYGTFASVCVMAGSSFFPHIYSKDPEVIALASSVLLSIVWLYSFIDTSQGALAGVMKGAGKQRFGAVITIISFFGIGLPTGALLSLVFKLHLYGVWSGAVLAVLGIFTGYLVMILRKIDWVAAAHEAVLRSKDEVGFVALNDDLDAAGTDGASGIAAAAKAADANNDDNDDDMRIGVEDKDHQFKKLDDE